MKTNLFTALLALAITFTLGCEEKSGSTFKDDRDGKSYKWVKIGTQTWVSENLNYNADGSKCYENQESNCQKYGRLYNWETAKSACPKGWHLPSDEEWQTLVDFAGGEGSGKEFKAKSGWNDYKGKSGNGTDDYGFSAIPGGLGWANGRFEDAGDSGLWWSSSNNSVMVFDFYMGSSPPDSYWNGNEKDYLFSVRCIKD